MSNFAVVLCATVLFASAFGASLQNSGEADPDVRIHDAKSKIDQRLREIRELIYFLDREFEGVNSYIIEQYKKNVTDRYNEGIETITRNMAGFGIDFQESKCKHYFDEYETFSRTVVDSLDKCIPEATTPVIESLRKAVREARNERERISNLTQVDNRVDSDVARVIGNLEKAAKEYVKLINGTMIQKAVYAKTPYKAFLDAEDTVFNGFINCAFQKKRDSSIRPEVVVSA